MGVSIQSNNLSAFSNTTKGQLPIHFFLANLCISFIELIKFPLQQIIKVKEKKTTKLNPDCQELCTKFL